MTNHDEALTLTDFLLARIAEDEAEVRRRGFPSAPARRVLVECEAKRSIIEWHADYDDPEGDAATCARFTLGQMATVYADHPDYREEWKP